MVWIFVVSTTVPVLERSTEIVLNVYLNCLWVPFDFHSLLYSGWFVNLGFIYTVSFKLFCQMFMLPIKNFKITTGILWKKFILFERATGRGWDRGRDFPSAGILPRMLQSAWAQQDEASSQELCLVAHDRAGV